MKKRIVAVYARVSTEHEAQLYALENQKQYYNELLEKHPEWTLYNMYIDQGLTGTSTKKRKSFLQMLEDAQAGCFDLIITREVSRFARNTVDTLVYTRSLKSHGVEVYFIEDNIWTLNDEDGELRLTIMATLAQNESQKISKRSKAGQHISFLNGVFYGTGNILGYDRVGKDLVVNEEQAKTVRTMYDLYLSGYGLNKIALELEARGHRTAAGLTKWHAASVGRTLKNPFYCGIIVYGKEYVEDYLSQKRKRNRGEIEQVVIKGKHQPLISEETYQKAMELMQSKVMKLPDTSRLGKKISTDIWVKKLECQCGHRMLRHIWHRKNGSPQYTYRCYGQSRTGSIQTRINHNLDIEGVCDAPWVTRWKLEVMLFTLFKNVWKYRDQIVSLAMNALQDTLAEELCQEELGYEKQLASIENKLNNLLDLRINEHISKEVYLEKKEKIENERKDLQIKANNANINVAKVKTSMQDRLSEIAQIFDTQFSQRMQTIPEEIVDVYVKKVVVYKDCFEWYLNCGAIMQCTVSGRKNNCEVSSHELNSKTYSDVYRRSGCYRREIKSVL